jgi:hypothetical protein
LVHLAVCVTCREAVEFERHAKNALRSLPEVAPSGTLVERLLALAEPGEPLPPIPPSHSAPVAGWRPHQPGPGRGWSARSGMGSRVPMDRRHRRVRVIRVGALSTCSVGATLVLLAFLGGAPGQPAAPSTPASVVPPVEEFAVEHARSTGGLPFVEPASLLVTTDGSSGDDQ